VTLLPETGAIGHAGPHALAVLRAGILATVWSTTMPSALSTIWAYVFKSK